jgi:cytoskeletal protein CcmA (bactofilin family)
VSQPNENATPGERELPPPAPKKAPPLTVIADGTNVGGRVNVTGDLRVDGNVEGSLLSAGGACEVSAQGVVAVEQARAASLVVHGKLRANEVLARRVVVMSAGELLAQVVAAEEVEVEDGGKLGATLEIGVVERQ